MIHTVFSSPLWIGLPALDIKRGQFTEKPDLLSSVSASHTSV